MDNISIPCGYSITGFSVLWRYKKVYICASVVIIFLLLIFLNMDQNRRPSVGIEKYEPMRTPHNASKLQPKLSINENHSHRDMTDPLKHIRNRITGDMKPQQHIPTYGAPGWINPCQLPKNIPDQADLFRVSKCEQIFYNRVPKCGSRTVLAVLLELSERHNYTLYHIVNSYKYFTSTEDLLSFSRIFSRLQKPFIYSQHLHFVNFTEIGVPQPFYINVIRDPVQRAISRFYYSEHGSTFFHKEPKYNLSLDECVQTNCGYLSTIHKLLPYFCGQHHLACRINSVDSLQRAKRTLREAYMVVGLTEDLLAFFKLLEWLMPSFFVNASSIYLDLMEAEINRTRTVHKLPVNTDTTQKLKDILALEYDFYEYAKQRFYELYHSKNSPLVNI